MGMLASMVALGATFTAASATQAAVAHADGFTPVTLRGLAGAVGAPRGAIAASAPDVPGYQLVCAPAVRPEGGSCRFARRIGDVEIAPSLALQSGVPIRALRFELSDGAVRAVTFRASPDRFLRLKEALSAAFGPAEIRRGSLTSRLGPRPQVTLTWGGRAEMTDPTPPDLAIEVRLTGRGAPPTAAPPPA